MRLVLVCALVTLASPVLVFGQTITSSNGIPRGTLNHWSVVVGTGGESRQAFVTARRSASRDIFTENVLFDYFSYVDVGVPGNAFRLSGSAPVADPADPNTISSFGSFTGENGNTINWTVTSTIPNGSLVMTSRFTFTTADGGTLGKLRFLQYMGGKFQDRCRIDCSREIL